jgi:glucose/arabinose dehydrogenase
MGHPFKNPDIDVNVHYRVSQALVEMLEDKCDLKKLLRLSVRKKIETYIQRTCGIQDINQSFRQWIDSKALKVRHRETTKDYKIVVEEIVTGLHIPWGFEFLNSHTLLINEKNGQLSLYNLKTRQRQALRGGPKVKEEGQGGSLDVRKHPDYPKVPWIYITFTAEEQGKMITELARFQIQGKKVTNLQSLLKTQSRTDTSRHFGSRIVFDGNKHLYFSVGDRGHRPNGQDLSTHAGSILRLHEDGRVPRDNPFVDQKNARPEIWSYGHRNPQGLAYDLKNKRLWAIEHGPRGGDEINLVEKGHNYGWATISHGKEYWGPIRVGESTHKKGMDQPVHYYVPSIAPCGMDLYHGDQFPKWQGNLFSGALKLTHLNRVVLKGEKFNSEERLLEGMKERIRHVKVGPAGYLYISTDSGGIFRIRPS